jgi:hypothetical protein
MAEVFEVSRVSGPMAFKSKDHGENGAGSGFTRVVVFKEEKAGHFNGNAVFHAFQVNQTPTNYMVIPVTEWNIVWLSSDW